MGTDSNNRAGSGAAYSRFAEEMDIDSVDLNVNTAPSKTTGLKLFCLDHWRVLIVLLIALCCFGIGIILGHFMVSSWVPTSQNGHHDSQNGTSYPNGSSVDPTANPTVNPTVNPTGMPSTNFMALVHGIIRVSNLQNNLKNFTSMPHHAGSQENTRQANRIFNEWQSYGFDVRKKSYTVLLSRPNPDKPNKITVLNKDTKVESSTFTPDDTGPMPNMLQPFAVYSSNASITNQPVYVNYATREDFKTLRIRTHVDHVSKICLGRMGILSLALMAANSKEQGCLGLIAFTDPEPFTRPGVSATPGNTFPNSWWLPSNAVIRESARLGMGDPTSPFFPSHDWTPRQPISNQGFPVQTISYDHAKGLFREMASPPAQDPTWIGRMGIDYFMGPGFHDQSLILNLEVNNEVKLVEITNVIATIPGTTEPDRYVIIGNHRDSLAYGAVDPGSGTVCLLEVARVLSDLKEQGWKPRRTIILASWDAGEDGSIGSTEWVEENLERLHSRAVAYINLDDAVTGNYSFAAAGSPLLSKVLFQATKDVDCPDPQHGNMKIYTNWSAKRPINTSINQPQLDPLGTTSDSAPFMMLAGVPSVDFKYIYDEVFYDVPSVPTYHTAFDQGLLQNTFIDPSYKIHAAITEVAVEAVMRLADSPKLPMDLTNYADSLIRYMTELKTDHGAVLTLNSISLARLEASVSDFSAAARVFQHKFEAIEETDELTLREMNDHIISVERAFLVNDGSALSPESRHLIYGQSMTSPYKGASFSPITMAITVATDIGDWTCVNQAVGYTTLGVQAATAILVDAHTH